MTQKSTLKAIAPTTAVVETPFMASRLSIRKARLSDLPALIALYADDDLGKTRETAGPDEIYLAAFEAIERDPNHFLAVAETDGEIVATLLLSFIPGLSRHGAWRAQIEAMRVVASKRGRGWGMNCSYGPGKRPWRVDAASSS